MTPHAAVRATVAALLTLVVCCLATPAQAALYCVEREADVVAGHRIHDGIVRCFPTP